MDKAGVRILVACSCYTRLLVAALSGSKCGAYVGCVMLLADRF